jgi:hypothetical protein
MSWCWGQKEKSKNSYVEYAQNKRIKMLYKSLLKYFFCADWLSTSREAERLEHAKEKQVKGNKAVCQRS